MHSPDPTQRFSDRVADYVRYRPGYPPAAIGMLHERGVLPPHAVVADIGAGTGILTELLLRDGHTVFAVEPNDAMRAAAEELCAAYPRLGCVAARAEETTLPDCSVDVVTAAQAFHWFDAATARREFTRILRPGGWVVLLWNERLTEATAFLREYEALLHRFATDYAQVDHRRVDAAALDDFFGAGRWEHASFPNEQEFDLAGLRGRLLSSSYAPAPGHPAHVPILGELDRLFGAHAIGGRVSVQYETRVQFGRLG